MAGLTDYTETAFLNFLRGTNLPTAPTTVYIGLNSADDDAGGSEVTATYLSGRAAYTASNFTSPATVSVQRQIKNSTLITVGTAIAIGASVPNFSVWDSLTGGNCLWSGAFVDGVGAASPLSFGIGDTITIPINGLILNLSLTGTSIYLRDKELNWLRGTGAGTAPTTYAGLATAVNADGTITEVTTTVRVAGRVTVSAWDAVGTSAPNKFTRNTNSINFGASAGAVTNLSHMILMDAATSGNLLKFPALPLARNVAASDPVIWQAGKVRIEQS